MKYNVFDTKISVIDETKKSWEITDDNRRLYREMLTYLGSIGYYVSTDRRIDKEYPTLSDRHNEGRYFDLKFKSEIYPAGFRITFYQDVIFENRNGGFYDFDKREKMPYLVGKEFELVLSKLKKFFAEHKVSDETPKTGKTAEEKVKAVYVNSWHKPFKNFDFSLADKWIMNEKIESYNGRDKDGKTIRNGELKYYYDWYGVLHRGIVYHDINASWLVMVDSNNIRVVQASDLFDWSEDCKRHSAPDRTPKKYKKHRKELTNSTTKELLQELKRRRKQ